MKIECIGHTFETAVRQILQLFFSLNCEMQVTSVLKDGNSVFTRIDYKGKSAEGVSSFAGGASRTERSDAVKRSCFNAARLLSDMPTPWGISTGIRPAKNIRALHKLGYTYEAAREHFMREYSASAQKAALATVVAQNEEQILDSMYQDGVSVYIGIPFCPTRCAYCSFISQSSEYNAKFIEPYVDALLREIEAVGALMRNSGKVLETLYFGGGTPTTLSAENLRRLFSACENKLDFSHLREFTVEAGRPDTIDEKRLLALKEYGVNRISINPQSMRQKTLDAIGRKHSVEDIYCAFEIARNMGFDNINADVIVGLPDETQSDVEYTMQKLLSLKPEAVTVHTMYLKRAANLIDDFERYRFADGTNRLMDRAVAALSDYKPYYLYKQKNTLGNLENVGFAKSGSECRYNVYIMEEEQTILALGGGGSTKVVNGSDIYRIYNPKNACDYISRIDEIIAGKEKIYENNA